ncbi:ATP-binding protein [Arcobacter sp. LA11]|uniref:ATP-binding protein n=1 Tax=Arcobacter sp. LA11 TaxID=1898176 RepID=UPI000933DA1C|nr:ATP-binding protein [Arcobacter sp. LA11]
MKKNNYRLITITTYIIISILAISMTINYVYQKEEQLLEKKYNNITANLENKLSSLIDKKKNATLALTITLANNIEVINILKGNLVEDKKLHKLSLLLRKETAFKNVWFQVLDNKGKSLFRSWSEKRNDNVYKFRADIREMLKQPRIKSTISVGRYDMTFKAMVPVYENDKFIGIIESITHFNSISRGLRVSNTVEPIIIVNEKYTKQLTKPFTNLFVDNHYIANISANKKVIDYLSNLGVKKIINTKRYFVDDKYLIINYPIYFKEERLANFIVFKDLILIDKSSIREYKNSAYLYLGLFIILLGLILYVISYYIYSKEITKLYLQLNKNQKELKELNESLKQTIDKEVEKNDKKNKIISHQNKLTAMGEMIENIAHQWRQPLSIISTAASGIKLKKELGVEISEEEEKDALDSIVSTSKYLSNTIDDFRYFFSQDKMITIFSSETLIEKVMNLIENEFISKDIQIIKNISSLEIESCENELLQVLINLLNNSKDELLKKDIKNKYIFISIYLERDDIVLKVDDNAGGIPKKIIDRIFEPYFTTKHQSQGTGIGLYMSEEIVSKHLKGSIRVQNIEYNFKGDICKGASFKIRIPTK